MPRFRVNSNAKDGLLESPRGFPVFIQTGDAGEGPASCWRICLSCDRFMPLQDTQGLEI